MIFAILSLVLINALGWEITSKHAAVTLVTGDDSGFSLGAIALGQSLIDVGSKLRRVVMVTPDVSKESRDSMSKIWEVREVKPILCNHKLDPSVTPDKYDVKDINYKEGIKRLEKTCTKFAAWTLHDFERLVFIDADILVVGPIDETLFAYSNASFVAAPEVFPPDNFNSGFIVLNPSKSQYKRILEANKRVGSAEGGDQGVFNNGVCPQWYYADKDDPDCGRLPWMYNVEVGHFTTYSTLRQMSGLPAPAAIHFSGDKKPWTALELEYLDAKEQENIHGYVRSQLSSNAVAHLNWRNALTKATNMKVKNQFLFALTGQTESPPKSNSKTIKDESKLKSKSKKKNRISQSAQKSRTVVKGKTSKKNNKK